MEDEQPNKRIIIPHGTLQPDQANVIEIPEACEDSRVLIARIQQRLQRPPRYYPPKTNPDNKFERKIGDTVVGLGMPALSPLKEERHNYQYSLSQYGSPKYKSCDPSYFGSDTTHGSHTISGKFDYCPTSTPKMTKPIPNVDYPTPDFSPIRMGRDIFAPDPSPYRSGYTPAGSPPRPPSMGPSPCGVCRQSSGMSSPSPRSYQQRSLSPMRGALPEQRTPPRAPVRQNLFSVSGDKSCSLGDLSDMMSSDASRSYCKEQSRAASPPQRMPARAAARQNVSSASGAKNYAIGDFSYRQEQSGATSPPQRKPVQAAARQNVSSVSGDKSCSLGDLSDMVSFDASRCTRQSPDRTPDSIKGMSGIYKNYNVAPATPVPEELRNSLINNSMAQLDHVELEELKTIQQRMRTYQEARRELVLSILSLPEVDMSVGD